MEVANLMHETEQKVAQFGDSPSTRTCWQVGQFSLLPFYVRMSVFIPSKVFHADDSTFVFSEPKCIIETFIHDSRKYKAQSVFGKEFGLPCALNKARVTAHFLKFNDF